MKALPRDHRGFVVPWFVQWQNGEPVFPMLNPDKWRRAVKHRLCWVCGQPLGRNLHFVIGPMCAINRITSEPPVHHDCADYSLRVCPFLSNPRMRRVPTERYAPDGVRAPAGLHEPRNPGVVVDWNCRAYRVFDAGNGALIEIGTPTEITWWTSGRAAMAAEIEAAIEDGAALLRRTAERLDGPEGVAELGRFVERLRRSMAPTPEVRQRRERL